MLRLANVVLTIFTLSLAMAPFDAKAQPFAGWPYRPEYDYGWGYVPLLGFGFDWKYPRVGEGYVPPDEEMQIYCVRKYRSYDPVSQTYRGANGLRYPCP